MRKFWGLSTLMIVLSVLLLPAVVLAQASQPASMPATPAWLLWLKANWVWLLLVVVLPSVITGLSKFPGPTVNKIIAVLQMIIDIFSITTHKDSPGTFKLPFLMRSKPPGEKAPSLAYPPGTTIMLLVPILCLTMSSCCVFRGDCKSKPGQIATMVVDCTVEAVKTAATDLLPAVIAILTSGGSNWSGMLDLLKEAGFDALACSLQQAGQEVQNMSMKAGTVDTHYLIKMRVAPPEVRSRINKYLGEVKGKDGKLYRVEFKKVTP